MAFLCGKVESSFRAEVTKLPRVLFVQRSVVYREYFIQSMAHPRRGYKSNPGSEEGSFSVLLGGGGGVVIGMYLPEEGMGASS